MTNNSLNRAMSLSLMWVSLGSFVTALILCAGSNYLGLLLLHLVPVFWAVVTRCYPIAIFYSVGVAFALVGVL